jgi:hypothetical protein
MFSLSFIREENVCAVGPAINPIHYIFSLGACAVCSQCGAILTFACFMRAPLSKCYWVRTECTLK